MKYLRYTGEFVSVAGVVWRVEILQEADAEFATIGSLEFPADEPLVIEWGNKSKEEVICSSIATLKILSPGDRTYEDLYSIEVGRVRMDVYRDNALYWSGCIDTEFYEEPYETLNGYEVSLTFGDFGVLDRLKYDLADMQKLYAIIDYCVGMCGINYGGIDESLISTSLSPSGSAMSLHSLKVRSDNFYDEDGEASTLAEVIEGILQPLALRMVQRCGKVYVYDLNGLYTKGAVRQVEWDGSSQTMGVDKVYNNAKITWNTYAQSGNQLPEKCWGTIETPASLTALNIPAGKTSGGATYFSYNCSTDMADWSDTTGSGFTLWTATEGFNAEIEGNARFFRIVPQNDGSEIEGVALYWEGVERTTDGSGTTRPYSQRHGITNLKGGNINSPGGRNLVFKTSPVWLSPVDNPGELSVRVRISLLMDPRFNPFESAANVTEEEREKDWYDLFNKYGNFVYVPVNIRFQPDGSDEIYTWGNKSIVISPVGRPVKTLDGTFGYWFTASNYSIEQGYLCYYDVEDRNDTSGVLGWKYNRPAINPHEKELLSVLANAEDGQYIPYPSVGGNKGGKLWVEVLTGWYIVNEADEGGNLSDAENGEEGLWDKIGWVLMKMPEVEIMNRAQFDQAIDTSDVEYNAEISAAAKEPIEIDTICGTSKEGVPTARGAYFNATTNAQIKELTRAGRTSQAEDLLIGTLYSQFGQRSTTLSGEARIACDPVVVYEEDNQGDKKFLLAEDVQNAREDTSEAVFVELRPDEYDRKN